METLTKQYFDERLDEFARIIAQSFLEVNQRFEAVDRRFDAVEKRIVHIETVMATKDDLESLRADLTLEIRKQGRHTAALTDELVERKVLDARTANRILAA